MEERSNAKGDDVYPFKWSDAAVKSLPQQPCINDNVEAIPDGLSDTLKVAILNSDRLNKLRGKPKSQIVALPEASDVARQFYCSGCKEIPFPWKTRQKMSKTDRTDTPRQTFLCENGHVICRSCADDFFNCIYCLSDYFYMFEGNISETSAASHFQRVHGSMGTWGQLHLCNSLVTEIECHFLCSMIKATEFSCRYFYNWCDYRGCGNELFNHQKNCPFREATH